jgi:hypothetical protein
MFRSSFRTLATALTLSTLFVGCSDAASSSAVTGPGEISRVRVVEQLGSGFTIVRETDAATGVVSGEIGSAGGSLSIGNHVLTVPAGAVTEPTLFKMTKEPGEIGFELSATRDEYNDVGHAGFNVPVTLTLSYADGAGVPVDASKLKVVWVKTDGTLAAQPTAVDAENQEAVGLLYHFSRYSLAFPD